MKDIPFTPTPGDSHLFNHIIVNGWVIILKDNRPVNYVADCGEILTVLSYYFVDTVFAELCHRWPNTAIGAIIVAVNNLTADLNKL